MTTLNPELVFFATVKPWLFHAKFQLDKYTLSLVVIVGQNLQKNCNFDQILKFDVLVPPSLSRAKLGIREWTQLKKMEVKGLLYSPQNRRQTATLIKF